MPQKKNPDAAELGRGKTGRVYGHLVSLLTMMKGLPLTYNRDLQEDKEPLFDTFDILLDSLKIYSGIVATLKVNTGKMEKAVARGYLLATDIADYLVKKGEPFRSAHGIVAKLVARAQQDGKAFSELTLEEYKSFSPLFEQDVFDISVASSMAARNVPGGTAPVQVAAALVTARKSFK
jgi:argininosuccinate lyase